MINASKIKLSKSVKKPNSFFPLSNAVNTRVFPTTELNNTWHAQVT